MTREEFTAFNTVPVVQSDETVLDPPLKGIYVFAEGDLKYRNGIGDEITLTLPASADAGGSYPFFLFGRIDKVFDTGTTLTDAQMLGLR